ncbi:hypothetical protein PGT21_015726 [Puccinia graminis f. sp. tritici]|uniref:Uncharacterized protein n=1 Tax=Puccinia graminis f. sp. tritici TaxID=56615 RepID=A0A5B0RA16_PUCGR|nr:hypothetical protein PGT21_015726 [Puccinia graminis f. sp. tritici]KAA1122158.1 hypothetical protein PGTUg99_030380 [Puccinia graminis f. sp. tritici]
MSSSPLGGSIRNLHRYLGSHCLIAGQICRCELSPVGFPIIGHPGSFVGHSVAPVQPEPPSGYQASTRPRFRKSASHFVLTGPAT